MSESESAAKHLTLFEAIRKRPGMYVGDLDTDCGLGNLILLVFDEFEFLFRAGRARRCVIRIAADGMVECEIDSAIADPDSASVDAYLRQLTGVDNRDKPVGGLRGVPICAVTALSEWLQVQLQWFTGSVELAFEEGRLIESRQGSAHPAAATIYRFLPSPLLFTGHQLLSELPGRLRDLTALLPGAEVSFADFRVHAFSGPSGLRALWRDRFSGREQLDNGLIFEADIVADDYSLTCVGDFGDGPRDTLSFVCGERTKGNGIHVFETEIALRRGLARFVREFAAMPMRCNWDWVLDGRLIVAVSCPEARFAGSVKERLTGPSRKQLLFEELAPRFTQWLRDTPAVSGRLLARAHESWEAFRFLRSWTGCSGCPVCSVRSAT